MGRVGGQGYVCLPTRRAVIPGDVTVGACAGASTSLLLGSSAREEVTQVVSVEGDVENLIKRLPPLSSMRASGKVFF